MIVPWNQPAAIDVSICVVNWNSQDLLAELLESIEQEGGAAAIETIIVDNASTDGSVAMTGQRFPWARVMTNDHNAGFARANNQAAAVARGRYLFFLNNDTRLFAGAVCTLARYLDENPAVVVAGPKTFLGDGRWYCSCRNLPTWPALLHRLDLFRWTRLFSAGYRRYMKNGFDPDLTQAVEQMDGAALMIRRTVLDACGSWDEAFRFGLDDVDLCARLRKVGPLMYVPTAAIVHHGSVSQRANLDYALRNFEFGYARYLAKHGRTRWTARLYKLLVTHNQMAMLLYVVRYPIKWIDYKRRGRNDLIERLRRELGFRLSFFGDLPRYWFT